MANKCYNFLVLLCYYVPDDTKRRLNSYFKLKQSEVIGSKKIPLMIVSSSSFCSECLI